MRSRKTVTSILVFSSSFAKRRRTARRWDTEWKSLVRDERLGPSLWQPASVEKEEWRGSRFRQESERESFVRLGITWVNDNLNLVLKLAKQGSRRDRGSGLNAQP